MTPADLAEVLEEIAGWSLQARREYIASIEKAFGIESAQQIENGLKELWEQRKCA